MKKTILILMIAFLGIITSMNAQTNLYDGIESGMSESELYNHVKKDNNSLEWLDDLIVTTIKDRDYVVTCFYNNNSVINQIILISLDGYEWMEYEPNVLENAKELYGLLENKYGEPVHNKWVDWTDIPDGKSKMIVNFNNNNINVIIFVIENDDLYSAGVIINDENFEDEETKSSGGF